MKSKITRLVLSAIFVFCLFSLGCVSTNEAHRFICVVDVSKSVSPEAQADAFSALQQIVEKLERGDSLVVIPLTGDAQTETQGRIERFELSRERKPYDEDKSQVFSDAKAKLEIMREASKTRPARKTDLLGALRLASEEILAKDKTGAQIHNVIIVLSDLLQDNEEASFIKDTRLADNKNAEDFARALAQRNESGLKNTRVYLGLLRSTDLAKLTPQRRAAVQTFWQIYLQSAGSGRVRIATDGPGNLAQFLQVIIQQTEDSNLGTHTPPAGSPRGSPSDAQLGD